MADPRKLTLPWTYGRFNSNGEQKCGYFVKRSLASTVTKNLVNIARHIKNKEKEDYAKEQILKELKYMLENCYNNYSKVIYIEKRIKELEEVKN